MLSRLRNISITQARKELGDVFNEVNYNKERVVLTNRKKRVAIVPIEDLERLEAMEDADDVHEAQSALKEIDEQGAISFDEMKKGSGS